MIVALLPSHTDWVLEDSPTVGVGFTLIMMFVIAEHPVKVLVPTTEYVVVIVGVTLMTGVFSVVDQV